MIAKLLVNGRGRRFHSCEAPAGNAWHGHPRLITDIESVTVIHYCGIGRAEGQKGAVQ